jgi:hypothetical protein
MFLSTIHTPKFISSNKIVLVSGGITELVLSLLRMCNTLEKTA